MAEMIYTEINPQVLRHRLYEPSIETGYDDLVESIKQDGIKSPLVIGSNNGTIHSTGFDGNHRLAIAFALGLDEIPVFLYSIHHKTGFDGEQINELDDIIRICGEDIKNESVWDEIRGAWKKLPYPKNQ
jgi:hypothetical protein